MELLTSTMLSTSSVNTVLHHQLMFFAEFFTIVLEFMGLIALVFSSFKAFVDWMRKNPATRLNLAEGLSMALSFKLGGEILRTVVVRDMAEIIQVGAIFLLRALMTLLIHWEIKNEAEEDLQKHHEKHTKK